LQDGRLGALHPADHVGGKTAHVIRAHDADRRRVERQVDQGLVPGGLAQFRV